MSLKIECFRLCGRKHLISLMKKLENYCVLCGSCKCCQKLTIIKNELERNGFYTYNSSIVCWKDFENCSSFTVDPCID